VKDGEVVSLIGANGAGKTTCVTTICGLKEPSTGEIFLKGERIGGKQAHVIHRKGIALVPEGRSIISFLTVEENLRMGAYSRKDKANLGEDVETMYSLFPVLRERKKQLGATLSGGEQQMLAISRALMSKPELLLLDEPSLGLAPLLIQRIYQMLLEIKTTGVTMLLIEQNARMALNFADRAYVLETGNITVQGDAKELLKDERIKEAYLGG
jgi:branched-chain amino acid transport system ATP-binding protein